jgi:ParB family chromosome partitioning protein
MIKMKGLGRGLDALLSGSDKPHGDEQRSLPVERLRPGKYQPRTQMDEGFAGRTGRVDQVAGRHAADSRACHRQHAGCRALRNRRRRTPLARRAIGRSGRSAGADSQFPDEQALAMALIENIQRENLNPLEEAQGLQRLIDEFGLTHQQAADAVGRSRPAATNLLRLLQLTAAVQDMLMAGKLDMGHARALLPVQRRPAGRPGAAHGAEGLVRTRNRAAGSPVAQSTEKCAGKAIDRDLLRLQEELSDGLGASVLIRANKKGAGKVTIDFGSLEQLDGLLSRIRG